MKLKTMRTIDRWIGPQICRVLSVYLFLKRLFSISSKEKPEERHVKAVLIQKYFGIGSILHSIPLIRGVRERYPEAKIVFVTFRPMARTIEICGLADELIVIPDHSFFAFAIGMLKGHGKFKSPKTR